MNQELALQTKTSSSESLSVFGNLNHFESAQRMAKALCSSPMVPENYRGEANIGSCLIALEMANRIGANVLSVCQNLYIVHGKPAWSSQFLIACVNASGRFSPMRYRATGTKGTDSEGCVAWATDKSGEKLESPEITIGTAKAEGWYQKNGSKWKTMPELMLRYRTATLFARLYAPEITLGLQCDDEVIDVVEVAPVVTSPAFVPESPKRSKKEVKPVADAVVVPDAKPAPEPSTAAPATHEAPPEPDGQGLTVEVADPLDIPPQSPEMLALLDAMTKHAVTPQMLIRFSGSRGLMKEEAHGKEIETLGLSDIRTDKIVPLTKNILAAGDTLRKILAS